MKRRGNFEESSPNKSSKTHKEPKNEDRMEEEEEEEDLNPEDPFEDEFEEEEVIENQENKKNEDAMEEDGKSEKEEEEEEEDEEEKENSQPKKIWRPGIDKLQEGEVLEHDSTAYEMLHSLNLEWSCLSFDIIPDKLGMERTRFPLTSYFVAGTQADSSINNKLFVLKLSSMYKTKYDNIDEEEKEEAEDDHLDEDPVLESRYVKHPGCINRVRIMPQEPHIVATWSENGHVYLWDLNQYIQALDAPPTSKLGPKTLIKSLKYSSEGYAIDWSHLVKGRLITGNCDKQIFVSEMHQSTWIQDEVPFSGHSGSVEDLSWSPTEATVFSSCSSDKTIKIWDTRMKKGPAVSWKAADCDVNVISWNKKVAYLLASGLDDGSFKVWDLRSLKEKKTECDSVGNFKWHNDQITSIQWDPNDESVLALSGADDQVSIWDLSMESDPESNITFDQNLQVPPQLLFLHQGQKDVKEVKWHPQILGLLASTAEDSFNIWKPSIEVGEEQNTS